MANEFKVGDRLRHKNKSAGFEFKYLRPAEGEMASRRLIVECGDGSEKMFLISDMETIK